MVRDWRYDNLAGQPYLRGIAFERKPYRAYSAGWDHDHCAACGAKFTEQGAPVGDVREGYATTAEYRRGADYEWICVPCFQEFSTEMGWIDATAKTPE